MPTTGGDSFVAFRNDAAAMSANGEPFHVLHGPCRTRAFRAALDLFKALHPWAEVHYDRWMGPDSAIVVPGLYSAAS